MSLLIFFVILFVLVLIHEFGHYIAAKKSGVRVEEFGFGLPPRLFGRKFGKAPKNSEEDDRTLFSFNLLPIGGFVRLTGEDAAYLDKTDSKNLQNAALWKRMVIVLAGVTMNFLLGILLFAIVYSIGGIPTDPHVLIGDVSPGSPASEVGIQSKDRIVSLNDQSITNSFQLQQIIKDNLGKEIRLVVQRNSENVNYTLVPRLNPPEGQGALGIGLEQQITNKFYPWYQMPFYGVQAGLSDTWNMTRQIVPALGNLFSSIFVKREIPEGVSGPVGLFKLTDQIVTNAEQRTLALLQFAGLLSVNLAVFNLLPFPALDGGRFAFYIYEAIFKRKPNPKFEQWTHALGLAILLMLLAVITYNDLFSKGLFGGK